jgi:hypothetical protein
MTASFFHNGIPPFPLSGQYSENAYKKTSILLKFLGYSRTVTKRLLIGQSFAWKIFEMPDISGCERMDHANNSALSQVYYQR